MTVAVTVSGPFGAGDVIAGGYELSVEEGGVAVAEAAAADEDRAAP